MAGNEGPQEQAKPDRQLNAPAPRQEQQRGLRLPPGVPGSLSELARLLSPERANRTTKVPLKAVMTLENQRGLSYEDALQNDQMWLTIAPIFSFVTRFAKKHRADAPIVRGSAVRHAAFVANNLDAMKNSIDQGEPIEELEELKQEREARGMHQKDWNAELLNLAKSKRDIPSQFFRWDIFPGMARHFGIDHLDTLRPQDGRQIQTLYQELFTGPDLDIKLPPMDEQTTLLFYQRLFGQVLPQMASHIATDTFKKAPDVVDGQMRRFAGSYPPPLEIDHHVIRANALMPDNLEHIMQARSLSELSQIATYTIDVPKSVATTPIWIDSRGIVDPISSLAFSVRLTPIRGGALYVGQIVYGATQDFPKPGGGKERRFQPIFTIDLPTRAAPGNELADARYSTAATTYDNTGVRVDIHPASPFKLPLSTYDKLEANMLIAPGDKVKFGQPVELGPDWDKTNEPQGLETATRALWQAIDTKFNNLEGEDSYVSPATLEMIRQRITRVGKAELLRQCNTPNGEFARASLQKNLMVMALVSPHHFVQYAGESGIWDLLFTQGQAPAFTEILTTLNEQISSDEYLKQLTSKNRPDPHGWELINNALVARPDMQQQLHKLIPNFDPTNWEVNMYYLTSLLTSSPK